MSALHLDRTSLTASGWQPPLEVRFLVRRRRACRGAALCIDLTDRPSPEALSDIEQPYELRLFPARPAAASPPSGHDPLPRIVERAERVIVGSRRHLIRLASRAPLRAARVEWKRPALRVPAPRAGAKGVVVFDPESRLPTRFGSIATADDFARALPSATVVVLTRLSQLGDHGLIDALLRSGRAVVAAAEAFQSRGTGRENLTLVAPDAGAAVWKAALEQLEPGRLLAQ